MVSRSGEEPLTIAIALNEAEPVDSAELVTVVASLAGRAFSTDH